MKRFLLAALLAAGGAYAAEPLPLWEAGIGAGAASTPAYPGSANRSARALALPFLIYRGEVLRSDQGGIGARLFHSDATQFDIGFALALPAHSRDVAARAGMPDLGTLIEFGPRLKLALGDPRLQLELPLRTVLELKGGIQRQGWTFEPKLAYHLRGEEAHSNAEAQLGMVVGDARINRYFYEVAPAYATVARPGYQAGAGLMLLRAGVSASQHLNQDLRVYGFVRVESYAGAANRASPLMERRSGASVGVAFAWTLARSSTPARP